MNTIEYQIQKLNEMKVFLQENAQLLYGHTKDLQSVLTTYKSQGLPADIANNFEQQHFNQTRSTVEAITNRMYSLHCSYIDSVIGDLTRALHR